MPAGASGNRSRPGGNAQAPDRGTWRALRRELAPYQAPVLRISLWQLVTSFGGFVAVVAGMYVALDLSFWLALALAPLAAGFMVRIFAIQHDCGHRSFFRSRIANDVAGSVCGFLTLTPYLPWRRQHAGHHRSWNDLDRRDGGADIYSYCLTVAEYRALAPRARLWHRVTRHPLVANVLAPPLVFLLLFRLPFDQPKSWRRERRAVYLTDLAHLGAVVGLGLALGFGAVAAVHLPMIVLAAIFGIWLFSIQHRFPAAFWTRHDRWNPDDAAFRGSSYLRLPGVLRWFTCNLGLHHVHHFSTRVPNYRLQACHERIVRHVEPTTLSIRDGLRAMQFALWDEERERMVTFREAHAST